MFVFLVLKNSSLFFIRFDMVFILNFWLKIVGKSTNLELTFLQLYEVIFQRH